MEASDIYHVTPEDAAVHLCDKLTVAWKEELGRKGSPSLSRAVVRVFVLDFSLRTTLGVIKDAVVRFV